MFIFYIDNDPDDCTIFSEVINQIDPSIKCLTCLHSQRGLEILSTQLDTLPDLLFLDVNMPIKDGVACLMEIRKNLHLADLSIVMFSTSISEANKKLFKMFNAMYVQKPMTYTKYIEVVKQIIETKRLSNSN